jgi:seryl-tRNA synthetase
MPIDINLLREKSDKNKIGDPDAVRKSQKDRFKDETLVDQVIELDEAWRKKNYEGETAQMKFNANNKDIATKKKAKEDCADLFELSKTLKADVEAKRKEADEILKQRD